MGLNPLMLNPFTLIAPKTDLTILEIVFEKKAFFVKYLIEKCYSEAKQQISIKYFVNFHFIFQVIFKIMREADDTL